MTSLEKLIEYFERLPGIGPRQARRFTYFLLTRNDGDLREMADLIKNLKSNVRICSSCYRFFQRKNGDNTCDICGNPNRDGTIMMIVSRDADLETIERSHSYQGKYFVLGGVVPILEKQPEQAVRAKELLTSTEHRITEENLKEIIVAMNATPEGEHTGDYIEKLLAPSVLKHSLKISHLGRGISTGTELEYSDADTIKNALRNRQ